MPTNLRKLQQYIEYFSRNLSKRDHEEADMVLVLQAIINATAASFSECFIYSPDTDGFSCLFITDLS